MDKQSEFCKELLRALTDDELFATLKDVEAVLRERGYRETPETVLATDAIISSAELKRLQDLEWIYNDLCN